VTSTINQHAAIPDVPASSLVEARKWFRLSGHQLGRWHRGSRSLATASCALCGQLMHVKGVPGAVATGSDDGLGECPKAKRADIERARDEALDRLARKRGR
jgi:hypothetical protein